MSGPSLYFPKIFPPAPANIASGSVPTYAGNPNGAVTGTAGTLLLDTTDNILYSSAGGTVWTAIGGSSSGTQLVTYTSGTPPNPSDITKAAIAYDPTGNLPTQGWNTTDHLWH